MFFVFLFFFFLLLPRSSGCFGGIPVAYSAQWRPVGLSPVHHRVSFVLRNSYSVPLIKWIFSLFLVFAITGFYRRGWQALSPTPNLEDQGTTVSLVSILVRPVRHGWPYQESKTPADIALWVNETRKPLYHGKAEVPKWPLRGKFFFLEQQILSTYSSSKCMKIRLKNSEYWGLKSSWDEVPLFQQKKLTEIWK